jgi:hypothetical protein
MLAQVAKTQCAKERQRRHCDLSWNLGFWILDFRRYSFEGNGAIVSVNPKSKIQNPKSTKVSL